jgi:hypothetical protein
MPLRDHFHPPVTKYSPWDSLHGAWPTVIVADLNKRLSPEYVASPRIHFTEESEGQVGGGAAVWAPPRPTLAVETELPDQDEYEVRIVDTEMGRLVATVEIVSPANKDRVDHRRAFVRKCATLLQQGVSVAIVDLVTTRRANLYGELLELLGQSDPSLAPDPPALYAVECSWRQEGHGGRLETWAHPLTVGRPLATVPLWLAANLAMPLDLESTYEDACRILRIP